MRQSVIAQLLCTSHELWSDNAENTGDVDVLILTGLFLAIENLNDLKINYSFPV